MVPIELPVRVAVHPTEISPRSKVFAMFHRLLLPMVCLAASWYAVARGETIYVDNLLGQDRANGLVAEASGERGPVRTLAAAMRLAGPSARIEVANTGVPYREMISLSLPRHSGSPNRPFTINGNGAVLDGTVVADYGAWQHVEGSVFAMRPRRLAYQQLFEGGKPLKRAPIHSVHQASALQPLEWSLVDEHLLFAAAEGKLPEGYELRHAGLQTGITLYQVKHVRIENLVVQGFQQDGINAHELVKHCELVDVESRANGRSGLSVGGVSDVTAVRSNFYDNGRIQVRTECLATLDLIDCDVEDEPVPAYDADGRKLTVDGKPVVAP